MVAISERGVEGENHPPVATSIYRPSYALTNEEIESQRIVTDNGKLLTASEIAKQVGIEKRYVADASETPQYMLDQAVEPVLARMPNNIAFAAISTSFPVGEHLASRIVDKYALAKNIALDFHAACSGFTHMLMWLYDNQDYYNLHGEYVLLAATEKYSPYLHSLSENRDRTVFSDGAGAIGFRNGHDIRILYAKRHNFGDSRHAKIIEEHVGMSPDAYGNLIRMPIARNNMVLPYIEDPIPPSETGYFEMDGPGVYKLMRPLIPVFIRETVKEAGLLPQHINLVITHQASGKVNSAIASSLPEFTLYPDMEEGNMSSVSPLKALNRALSQGRIGPGSVVEITAFGAGPTASSAIIKLGKKAQAGILRAA